MRRIGWTVVAVLFLFPPSGRCQNQGQEHQQDQGAAAASAAGQATNSGQASGNAAPQQESLAEAARKAREAKKAVPKAATVFTNENLPPEGAAPKPEVSAPPAAAEAATPPQGAAAAAPAAAPAPLLKGSRGQSPMTAFAKDGQRRRNAVPRRWRH